jgi:hypothetical protein
MYFAPAPYCVGCWASIKTTILSDQRKEFNMLWTICVVLFVLWALGLLTGYTMGGVIHALLVIAIIVVLVRVLQGRRPV